MDQQDLFMETPELLAEKRKQEIAAMLLKQLSGGAPKVEKTRILAKQPILGTLLNAGGQWLAKGDLQRADQRVGEITQNQQQARQQEYSQAAGELSTATDKNAAIAKWRASRDPMVRALAEAELKAVREAAEKEAERKRQIADRGAQVLGEAGQVPQALQVLASQGVDPAAPMTPFKEPTVETIDLGNNQRAVTTKNYDKYGRPTITATAPGSVTNVGSSAQKVGLEKLFGAGVDQVVKNAEIAQGALKLQGTLNELESRSNNGIIDGPATVPLTWVTGLAKSAGLPVDPQKLANTETFNAFAQEAVQNLIQQMPRGNAGITAPEAERISKIMPNAAQSAETRAEIVAILRAANARTLAAYQQSIGGLLEAINTQDPKKADFNQIFLPSSLDSGATPTKTPMQPGKPAGGGAIGGQTPEVMAERIRIVQAEFDAEKDPATKAALGRELARLRKDSGQASGRSSAKSPAAIQAEIDALEKELGIRK